MAKRRSSGKRSHFKVRPVAVQMMERQATQLQQDLSAEKHGAHKHLSEQQPRKCGETHQQGLLQRWRDSKGSDHPASRLIEERDASGQNAYQRGMQRRQAISRYEDLDLFERLVPLERLTIEYGRDFSGKAYKRHRNPAARPSTMGITPQPDPRIRAIGVVDSLNLFDATRAPNVHVPVQLWASELGGDAVALEHVAAIRAALPQTPGYRIAKGAGHFANLAPCSPDRAGRSPNCASIPPAFVASFGIGRSACASAC